MFALIQPNQFGDTKKFDVLLYDVFVGKWYMFDIDCPPDYCFDTVVGTADGGLLCFVAVSNKSRQTLRICVCNPLKFDWEELPLPRHVRTTMQLKKGHMETDCHRNCYKVLAVSQMKGGILAAELFDSFIGTWNHTNLSSNPVYGYQYLFQRPRNDYNRTFLKSRIGPCAHDSMEGQLLRLHDASNPLHERSLKCHAFLGDHLFVLHEEIVPNHNGLLTPEYIISEFQGGRYASNWITVKEYSCRTLFRKISGYSGKLYACKGWLLLLMEADGRLSDQRPQQLLWLLDFSAGVWHVLPDLPRMRSYKGRYEIDEDQNRVLMYEVQWNAP